MSIRVDDIPNGAGHVKVLNIAVTQSGLTDELYVLLEKLRPHWNRERVKYVEFNEGISNRMLGCYDGQTIGECEDATVIRIFGQKSDLIVDRNMEILLIELMAELGLGPKLECIFKNGLVTSYLCGVCLDEISVKDPHISRLVAKEMVRWHAIAPDVCRSKVKGLELSSKPFLFHKMRTWLDVFPSELDDPIKNARFQAELPKKADIIAEVELLQQVLVHLGSPVVLCHNDLLLKNIVFNKATDSVTFIDYEYGCSNFEAFDIANHFAEYAGVTVVDYSLYPDEEYQMEWLADYLRFKAEYASGSSAGVPEISREDIRKLYIQVNKFTLASHLFWGIWSTVQARYSEVNFDYVEYALIRYGEYFRRKAEFLALF